METREFNAILKDISDEVLISGVQHGLTKMCVNREVFTMTIPPDPERDFDILLGELIRRYKLSLPVELPVKPATCETCLYCKEMRDGSFDCKHPDMLGCIQLIDMAVASYPQNNHKLFGCNQHKSKWFLWE